MKALQFTVDCVSAPGGTLADDMMRTNVCVFAAQEDLETMQAFAQVSETVHHSCRLSGGVQRMICLVWVTGIKF